MLLGLMVSGWVLSLFGWLGGCMVGVDCCGFGVLVLLG